MWIILVILTCLVLLWMFDMGKVSDWAKENPVIAILSVLVLGGGGTLAYAVYNHGREISDIKGQLKGKGIIQANVDNLAKQMLSDVEERERPSLLMALPTLYQSRSTFLEAYQHLDIVKQYRSKIQNSINYEKQRMDWKAPNINNRPP